MSALTEIEATALADRGLTRVPRPRSGARLRSVLARDLVRPSVVPGEAVTTAQPRSSSIGRVSAGRGETLVTAVPMPGAPVAGAPVAGAPAVAPRSVTAAPGARRPVTARPVNTRPVSARPAPARLRLTRRGRIVVGSLIVAAATAAALLVLVLASGGAQATNHGRSGGGYQGMHRIVVQPGQTLWSIASAAEPSADPRGVIQQIISVNDLTGTSIAVGQELWIPR